jgi:hypothetical protein
MVLLRKHHRCNLSGIRGHVPGPQVIKESDYHRTVAAVAQITPLAVIAMMSALFQSHDSDTSRR